jgi:serine/threonine protein kinase
VTVRDGDTALKLPLKYGLVDPKGTYTGHDDDIVSYLDLSGVGIRLALMENGDLQDYLNKHKQPPDRSQQLIWFRAMARGLVYVHKRRVLVGDISLGNFLVSANLSVKLSDFNQSTILPLNTDMGTADDHGYSIYTDIGQLGAVFYRVATGQPCEFDLFKDLPYEPTDAVWPQRKDLPSTDYLYKYGQ